MKIVAIIPARAGSKGLPGKNLRPVGGISLVGRAILAAVESGVFSDIIVTTDGDDIAEEARRYGAKPIFRPDALASDDARSIDAVCHALQEINAHQGICVLLQPTSPLRLAKDIFEAVEQKRLLGPGSIISVCECDHHPFKTFELRDGKVVPTRNLADLESPRQSLPKMYRPNGAIYVNDIVDLFNLRSFFIAPIQAYEMSASQSVDIDSELDLMCANSLIGAQK